MPLSRKQSQERKVRNVSSLINNGPNGLVVVLVVVAFLVVCTALGLRLVSRVLAFFDRKARSNSTMFALALAFALGVSQLATMAKLGAIRGTTSTNLLIGSACSLVVRRV